MKRLIGLFLVCTMLLSLGTMAQAAEGAAEPKKCVHPHIVRSKPLNPTKYTLKDYKTHTITDYYNLICRDCGEIWRSNETSAREEPHKYAAGRCICGYKETKRGQTIEDGLYYIKNVSSGYMMNVFSGNDAKGTEVTVWEPNETDDQKIYVSHQGYGKYLLKYHASQNEQVIAVNRGINMYAPIEPGDPLNLWTANDEDAHLFYITACNDGSYLIELAYNPWLVVAPTNETAAKANGTQLRLTEEKDLNYQKWHFVPVTSVPTTAFSDVNDTSLQEAISTLAQFNIINGYEDGTFRPEANITRAEFAKIICKALLFETAENDGNDFFDVTEDHWAKEFVYTAKKLGIINGITSESFAPGANITYEQATKMVVASLGYQDEATLKGGYPEGYMAMAEELALLDNIEYEPKAFATRENIVLMIENALNIPFYFLSESNGVVVREKAADVLYKIHLDRKNEAALKS